MSTKQKLKPLVVFGCLAIFFACISGTTGAIVFGLIAALLGGAAIQVVRRQRLRASLEAEDPGMVTAMSRARHELVDSGQARPDSEWGVQAVMTLTALATVGPGLLMLFSSVWPAGLFFLCLGAAPTYFQIKHLRMLATSKGEAGVGQVEDKALETFRVERREKEDRRELQEQILGGRLSIQDAASDQGDLSLAADDSALSVVPEESEEAH